MWLGLSKWAKEKGVLEPRERALAYGVGKRLRNSVLPTIKQAKWAVIILEKAKQSGFDPTAMD